MVGLGEALRQVRAAISRCLTRSVFHFGRHDKAHGSSVWRRRVSASGVEREPGERIRVELVTDVVVSHAIPPAPSAFVGRGSGRSAGRARRTAAFPGSGRESSCSRARSSARRARIRSAARVRHHARRRACGITLAVDVGTSVQRLDLAKLLQQRPFERQHRSCHSSTPCAGASGPSQRSTPRQRERDRRGWRVSDCRRASRSAEPRARRVVDPRLRADDDRAQYQSWNAPLTCKSASV